MKQRIISAAVGLAILAWVFLVFETIILNVVVAIIVVMALNELITAAGQGHSPMSYISMGFGAMVPFFKTSLISQILPAVCFVFSVLLFSVLLRYHRDVRAEQIGFIFFFTVIISFSVTCFIYMRDVFTPACGLYGVLLALGGAWMSDTGAYFCGRAFGKRKLAPGISPNKTVEGLLGGFVVALFSNLLIAWGYVSICGFFGAQIHINYYLVALASPVITALGVLGDLSASVLKRQFGIKDFGNIMPGHGGVLDRFDSVLMVAPLVYNLLLYFPVVRLG